MEVLHFEKLPKIIPYNAQVSIDTNRVTPVTHGFHKYPGKFIPQIPRWAINTYLNNNSQNVLDPFVGSGTSLVEATALGYNSYGIDIDPLSCLISKVKSTPINVEYFSEISDWIITSMKDITPVFMPETKNLPHWFTEDATLKLRKIRTLIDEIPNKYQHLDNITDLYDVFIIAFSSIIRRVSNADNQSQKTYVSGTMPKKPAEVYTLFTRKLVDFADGFNKLNKKWNKKSGAVVINTNGNADFSPLIQEEIDLIVTSPPYIKSIDYVYNQMVELFWIGDLFNMDTQPKQNIKRRKYTGTTLILKKQYDEFFSTERNLDVKLLNDSLVQVLKDEKNGEKHGYIVYNYFNFMKEHFKAAGKVLKSGGVYVMAVGNSSVSNVNIDTAEVLIELAKKNGLKLETRWNYLIKNHFMGFDRKNKGGKIEVDHILVFKNR